MALPDHLTDPDPHILRQIYAVGNMDTGCPYYSDVNLIWTLFSSRQKLQFCTVKSCQTYIKNVDSSVLFAMSMVGLSEVNWRRYCP